jgi:hypothetical protein
MKPGKSTTLLITNGLLWATAMIGSSLILAGTAYAQKMLYLLLALSTGSLLLLEDSRKSIKSEWRCIQKRFKLK